MRFFESGFLIKGNPDIPHTAIHFLTWKQVDLIYRNIDRGFVYPAMSPTIDLTREQVAWLISNKNEMGRFRKP